MWRYRKPPSLQIECREPRQIAGDESWADTAERQGIPHFHDSNVHPFLLKGNPNICVRVTIKLKTETGFEAASSIAIWNGHEVPPKSNSIQ